MESKTETIERMLREGETVLTCALASGCTMSWVYQVRAKMKPWDAPPGYAPKLPIAPYTPIPEIAEMQQLLRLK